MAKPLCLYGDPAYPLGIHLQAPYRQNPLTPQMALFNKAMSEVRVAVEWLFGDIANYFKFMDFKKQMKINLSSADKCILYVHFWRMPAPALMAISYQLFLMSNLHPCRSTFGRI